ncbi:ROK family protein [Acididesulfobacillus acetoxydans]|uniref:ROK family protein n=1 Tax=Acididesulfobacillus acetoxydans TaxID=1561005 RepID=UPI001F10056F|nr:ROK family protein [Acididesulfobacillus acetoxydans]
MTRLTPAAMTGIVRELVELGYVQEVGLGKSSGGRRPVKLQFSPESGYVVGVEITRQKTVIGLADLQAKPLLIKEQSLDMSDPVTGLRELIPALRRVVTDSGIAEARILGAGFVFPGLIDKHTKVLKRAPNLGEAWRDLPVKEWLERDIHVPVFIENNSNAAALAEYVLGQGKETKDLVYINLGEGFGSGVLLGGNLVLGASGYAGEFGHLVLVEDGPLCNCGNKGCLESLYAVPALVRKVNNELPLCPDDDPLKKIFLEQGEVGIKDILVTAQGRGSYARQVIEQAGRYIGLGVASLINLYNPALVSLGGILSEAGNLLLEPLTEVVQSHAFPEMAGSTKIQISRLGKDTGFYGACVGVIEQLFDPDRGGQLLD